VLRVGLTGGIGSGKSTVARRLAALGAVLVDSDVLAREVVAPGTGGLDEIVAAFGADVLGPDGALDRPALAAVVFADPHARERLNAIVHPRVRARTEELVAAAAADAVVVQDVPLLVETGSPAAFALVVVVHADAETRVRRLVEARGMSTAEAWARIAAQADDAARRAAADVWLENTGTPDERDGAVDVLWRRRLVPFEANLRARRPVLPHGVRPVDPDPGWAAAGARLADRVARAAGGAGRGVAHVGPTAVPGLPADDVLDVQLAVDGLPEPASVRAALDAAGFPRLAQPAGDWRHAGADPGRPVRVHVRAARSPAWRAALLRRDWLRSDAAARSELARLVRLPAGEREAAQHRWEESAVTREEDWAATSGWTPSLDGVPHAYGRCRERQPPSVT
jgi:dephospho-CoA kinase